MQNDTQLKHFVWWIIRQQGKLPETYAEFINRDLSEDVCRDIDELVSHIKLNY